MKITRRIAAVALAAALLAGCGASGGGASADTTTTTTAAEADTTTSVEVPTLDAPTTTEDAVEEVDDVDAWAQGFCESFDDRWLTEILDLSANADSTVVPGDLHSVKAAFVALFRDSAAVTTTLIDEFEALGVPDVDNGEEIHAELLRLFGVAEQTMLGAANDMESLSVDDPTFREEAMDLVDEFGAATEDLQRSFEQVDVDYPSPELGLAINLNCSL